MNATTATSTTLGSTGTQQRSTRLVLLSYAAAMLLVLVELLSAHPRGLLLDPNEAPVQRRDQVNCTTWNGTAGSTQPSELPRVTFVRC